MCFFFLLLSFALYLVALASCQKSYWKGAQSSMPARPGWSEPMNIMLYRWHQALPAQANGSSWLVRGSSPLGARKPCSCSSLSPYLLQLTQQMERFGLFEGEIMNINNGSNNTVCQVLDDNTIIIIITIIHIANNYWALTIGQILCRLYTLNILTEWVQRSRLSFENIFISLLPTQLDNAGYLSLLVTSNYCRYDRVQSRVKQNFRLRSDLNLPGSLMASQLPSTILMKTSCAPLQGLPP